ncbi:MAG: hypothetical protein ACXW18_09960 [Pyrinomonadaceae bacterium]
MKVAAFLIALFMILLGVTGLVAPHLFFSAAEYTATPGGLYAVAAIRLAIGIILLFAAKGSRFPRTLRVFGVLALIGGIATLFLGTGRAREIADWAIANGTIVIRAFGLFAIAVGSFIAYAVNTRAKAGA